ncbi:MAG: VOC family protein [Acidimicrobiales bacterium]
MASAPETRPARPAGVNHLVLNVRDIEASHRFYTEVMGFEFVCEFNADSPNPMRFYRSGPGHHHDIAVMQVKNPAEQPPVERWRLSARQVGVNHIAIGYPDRAAFLQQIAHLQANGVEFVLRGDHGMTHSAYISDPDGYGLEVLYELPAEVWEGDLPAAMNYFKALPKEGPESLADNEDYTVFSAS